MIISDEAYEEALSNNDNLMIMHSAGSCFLNILDDDEIHRCKLMALWEALKAWNPDKGRKFTAFLYQRVCWECLKSIHYQKRYQTTSIGYLEQEASSDMPVYELLDSLPPDLRNMVEKRYIYRMTLREIGDEYGYCYETIRKRLKKASNCIKTAMLA